MLDETEHDPHLRIVRVRTSLVFQRAAASEVHRLFLGPLVPWHLPRPLRLVPLTATCSKPLTPTTSPTPTSGADA